MVNRGKGGKQILTNNFNNSLKSRVLRMLSRPYTIFYWCKPQVSSKFFVSSKIQCFTCGGSGNRSCRELHSVAWRRRVRWCGCNCLTHSLIRNRNSRISVAIDGWHDVCWSALISCRFVWCWNHRHGM